MKKFTKLFLIVTCCAFTLLSVGSYSNYEIAPYGHYDDNEKKI